MPAPEGERTSPESGAAAAFLAALGLAFVGSAVLSIIGAPPRLTAATASVGVLLATCGLGLALAARTLPEFVGGWAARAPQALGFAFAAGAAAWGLGLSDSPWIGLAAGLGAVAHALLAAPLASCGFLSDGLATRFPNGPLRAAFAAAFFAIGASTAMAGVRVAQMAAGDVFDASNLVVDVALAFALALSAAPGGARATAWIDGMSGALVAAFTLGLAGVSLAAPSAGFAPLKDDWAQALAIGFASPSASAALVAALAGFAPLGLALGGAQGGVTMRARLAGPFAFALSLVALSFDRDALAHASGGLAAVKSALALLSGLALARLGTLVAARAFGSIGARQGAVNIASLRLARLRLATVALAALFAALARRTGQPPSTLALCGLALSLALIVPALALARLPRAGPLAVGAALCVGVAAFAFAGRLPESLADFSLASAWQGALAALAAGVIVAMLFPRDEEIVAPAGRLD